MCLVWLNRSGVDATFYDAVEFDPMLTVTIGRNRPIADTHLWAASGSKRALGVEKTEGVHIFIAPPIETPHSVSQTVAALDRRSVH